MSLQVNFSTHSKAIQASYKAILDGDDSINWVVYGYDKGTNDLKVLAQGSMLNHFLALQGIVTNSSLRSYLSWHVTHASIYILGSR